MNVKELQEALRTLESAYSAGGAAKQAREIGELVNSLEQHSDRTIEELALIAASQLKPKTKPAPGIDHGLVERYADGLFAAGTDRSSFDRIFLALKSDKAAKIGEIVEIANRYQNQPTNGTFRFKFDTKSAALDFIFSTFMGRAESESRIGIIERMTKWAGE